jgi:hypothetical protein
MSAADFQALAFSDLAPLRSVGFYSQDPLTLDVRGSSFVGVTGVNVNGTPALEYIVVSSTRILVQVPKAELHSQLKSVRVILARSGLTAAALVSFDAVVPGVRATGFTKMMQAYLRVLFTNPGDDLAYPWLGGGMYGLVGSAGTPSELRARASVGVNTAAQHLIRLQVRNPVLTDAEKLRSATLLQADYNSATSSINARIALTALDGTTGNPLVSV